jgi:hypothetical protein
MFLGSDAQGIAQMKEVYTKSIDSGRAQPQSKTWRNS